MLSMGIEEGIVMSEASESRWDEQDCIVTSNEDYTEWL